ncbi:hypothetical protein AAG612_02965 [Citromicrobium bathyomarinum]|uniref:hypothetical protein n=1 Tax=Citromicrobium bathyomarinum TaxID=72174 RepID=UPI00315A5C84
MEDMSGFDFVTLIFAIPMGLAIVEIAQGLSLSLRRRKDVRLGWLTPMLAIFLILNTAALLEIYWEWRGEIAVSSPILVSVLLLSILYYVAASFVFPHQIEDGGDLDDWFMENRRYSLGGTFVIFAVFAFGELFLEIEATLLQQVVRTIVTLFVLSFFLVPILVAIRSRRRRTALIAIGALNLIWIALLVSYTIFA